jgi:hypothetical protein
LLALKRQALADLAAKCNGRKCLVCDGTEWLGSGVFALYGATGVLKAVGSPSEMDGPVVAAVRCKACAYLLLFDAAAVSKDLLPSVSG